MSFFPNIVDYILLYLVTLFLYFFIFSINNNNILDHLPSEIIQKILKYLVKSHYNKKLLDYQLISTRWHRASMDVVYKKSLLRDKHIVECFPNFLESPTYNYGQYVKKVTTTCTKNTAIWKARLKYCTNVEELNISGDSCCKAVWDYVLLAQESSDKNFAPT